MGIGGVSPYQQMQNWRASQANFNTNLLGSLGAPSSVDFGAALANAAANTITGSATLAAQQALTRVQQQSASASSSSSSTSTADTKLSAAKTAGAAILQSLGIGGNPYAPAPKPSSSTPYSAPVNSATGYSYVQTSAASAAALTAVNILA